MDLGINFMFKQQLMEWNNATIPMLDPASLDTQLIDNLEHENLYMHIPNISEDKRI